MKPSIVSIYGNAEITTGAHKRHLELLRELRKREYSVYLFSPTNFLEQTENYFEIAQHKECILPKSFQTLLAVRKKIKEIKEEISSADKILLFGFSNFFASHYLQKKLDIPLIFVVRANIYEYRKINFRDDTFADAIKKHMYLKLFKKLAGYAYKQADKLIVQNKEDYNNLVCRYDLQETKVQIIRNNINFPNSGSSEYTNTSTELKSIVFVGSLTKRKGVMSLAKAVKELTDENIQVRLDVLGDGALRNELEFFVKNHNLESQIILHGYLSDPLKKIAESDLLVMPSLMDSFPNAVLEAFSVGTPVIGSDVGGIAEILKYNSLLFRPGSINAIKEKIKFLLDKAVYKEVKQTCMERRSAFIFDWTKEFEKVILNTQKT